MKEQWFKTAILKHLKDNPSSAIDTLFPKSTNFHSFDHSEHDRLCAVTPQTHSFESNKKYTEHAPDGDEASMENNSRCLPRGGNIVASLDYDSDLFSTDSRDDAVASPSALGSPIQNGLNDLDGLCQPYNVDVEVRDCCDNGTVSKLLFPSNCQDKMGCADPPSNCRDEMGCVDPPKRMNNFELNISSADIFELISAVARGDEGDDVSTSIVKKYLSASVSDRSSK